MTKLTSTQPKNFNQLNVVNFEVSFSRLPHVEYFCQRITIPSVILGDTFLPTPFLNAPVEGDTLQFEALTIGFILDEDLKNYQEIYAWMLGLGFPKNFEQFKELEETTTISEDASRFSDMDVIFHTNKSNPNYRFTFTDVSPTSLSSVGMDTTTSTLDPIIIDTTFNFKGQFEIAKIE